MVNEKDLQSYLKIAAPALPCRAARKSVWTSGNSAYLNATLSRNGTFIPVSLSLCCDAYGNVS